MRTSLSVRPPYRLDLTVEALRRVRHSVVDVMTLDGRYLRALPHAAGVNVVEVRQISEDRLDVRITGTRAQDKIPTPETMLGTQVDLSDWYEPSKGFRWLKRLANELWEALCHGIIFQQLSIVAAAAILQRFVERFASPVSHGEISLHPFPRPEIVAQAHAREFRSTMGSF